MDTERAGHHNVMRPTSRGSIALRRMAVGAAGLLIVLPVLRMLSLVHGATRTEYYDYWWMFQDVFTERGSLSVSGLFKFHTIHPVVVAKLLYWLNYKLFAGSNVTLGYIVILIGLGTLAVLALIIRRAQDQPFWTRIAILALASALLFGRHGVWNFVHAMSGAAWLTANLFAIAALGSAIELLARCKVWAWMRPRVS